jgi:hypothetical protein
VNDQSDFDISSLIPLQEAEIESISLGTENYPSAFNGQIIDERWLLLKNCHLDPKMTREIISKQPSRRIIMTGESDSCLAEFITAPSSKCKILIYDPKQKMEFTYDDDDDNDLQKLSRPLALHSLCKYRSFYWPFGEFAHKYAFNEVDYRYLVQVLEGANQKAVEAYLALQVVYGPMMEDRYDWQIMAHLVLALYEGRLEECQIQVENYRIQSVNNSDELAEIEKSQADSYQKTQSSCLQQNALFSQNISVEFSLVTPLDDQSSSQDTPILTLYCQGLDENLKPCANSNGPLKIQVSLDSTVEYSASMHSLVAVYATPTRKEYLGHFGIPKVPALSCAFFLAQ